MTRKTERTEAQKKAETRYNEKRRQKPSIPAIRLEEAEKKFTDRVFKRYGKSKKEAVLERLHLLEEKLKNEGK